MIKWLVLPPGSSAFSGCFGISLRNYYSLKPKDREWTVEFYRVGGALSDCKMPETERAAGRTAAVHCEGSSPSLFYLSHRQKAALLRPSVRPTIKLLGAIYHQTRTIIRGGGERLASGLAKWPARVYFIP